MLKKINRSLNRDNFEVSRTSGVMYQTPLFGLSVVKKEDGENQFGFVISRKISKKAVERNRIRRILAESVKQNLTLINQYKANFVFLVKMSILKATSVEIETEVKIILGLIK